MRLRDGGDDAFLILEIKDAYMCVEFLPFSLFVCYDDLFSLFLSHFAGVHLLPQLYHKFV